MATMLTARKIAERYISERPETNMSRNCIVCLLRSGCIPCVSAGNRRFYSYEGFISFLEHGNSNERHK